ncbi:MAG: flippase-like domain-containing protein [Lentisphaeria bacterium]|nr:flippase-like domain-containing protein [Lentisphaeria bacterium]
MGGTTTMQDPQPIGPTPAGTPPSKPAAARGGLTRVCRGLALLVFCNALCGLVSRLPPAAGPGQSLSSLVHGDLADLLLRLHSPAPAWALAGSLPAATVVLLAAGFLVGVSCILWLRPAALVAMTLAASLLLLTLRATGADLWADLRAARAWLLILAVLCYGVVLMATVVRWGMLLSVQGVHLPLGLLTRLTLIGVFFNLAIPGAVGGDLVKMGYVARAAPARKAEAVLTIFLDRVVGLLGLFLVAAVAVLASLPMILGMDSRFRPLQAGALVVGLGSIGGVAGVLLLEYRSRILAHPRAAALLSRCARHVPARVAAILARLAQAIELYRERRGVIVRATLLAVAVHVLLAVDLFLVGKALGERTLGLQHYVVVASVANTVASVPITPGGMGTRDATAAAFFTAFAAEPVAAIGSIPVTLSIVFVLWALVGAVVFLASPGAHDAATQPTRDT